MANAVGVFGQIQMYIFVTHHQTW